MQCQQKAMVEYDGTLFNQSFSFFTKGNRVALALIVIQFSYQIIFLYQDTVGK